MLWRGTRPCKNIITRLKLNSFPNTIRQSQEIAWYTPPTQQHTKHCLICCLPLAIPDSVIHPPPPWNNHSCTRSDQVGHEDISSKIFSSTPTSRQRLVSPPSQPLLQNISVPGSHQVEVAASLQVHHHHLPPLSDHQASPWKLWWQSFKHPSSLLKFFGEDWSFLQAHHTYSSF